MPQPSAEEMMRGFADKLVARVVFATVPPEERERVVLDACERVKTTTPASTELEDAYAEIDRLRAIIERYIDAETSGEDATQAWDELVQTVW